MLSGEPNFYGVTMREGQDGKSWRSCHGCGSVRLLTVPPYFVRSTEALLLPEEVFGSDGD